ncbi:aminoglycoside phosphotransferase [Arthrobacter sp. UYP6]|uniref:aminoglycoside phosphotransferase family protein n=1 Tax=Arthrobacter sp. UYP6 TaxID=1756378 RepID=UPI0033977CEA
MSGPLTAALRPLGLVPASWSHLRSHHRPGAGISALYRVEAVPRSANRAQQPLRLQVGATTASLSADQHRNTVRGAVDDTVMRLWVHPRDPVLSGLTWATSPGAVARNLFGAEEGGARAALKLVAYRPLRRAVIRARFNGVTAYLKVPQPRLASELRRRLELAASAGLPVPPLLPVRAGAGPDVDAVLALGSLPGRNLHQELREGSAAALDPGVLTGLLAGLPGEALAFPRRPAWSERVLDYAAGAAVALPEAADRIIRCARETDEAVRSAVPGPVVPTHGDFHGGNLLAVSGQGGLQLSGMLDVDSLGPGYRVDDLACFLGHLYVFAALNPRHDGLRRAAERFADAFAADTDPAALYSRSAAVALTLVAGASGQGSRGGERALATAEELLARSRNFLTAGRKG